jgi:hypothetical protein
LGVGRKADNLALQKYYCCEIQRNENSVPNLAEFSEEGYGSNIAVDDDDDEEEELLQQRQIRGQDPNRWTAEQK